MISLLALLAGCTHGSDQPMGAADAPDTGHDSAPCANADEPDFWENTYEIEWSCVGHCEDGAPLALLGSLRLNRASNSLSFCDQDCRIELPGTMTIESDGKCALSNVASSDATTTRTIAVCMGDNGVGGWVYVYDTDLVLWTFTGTPHCSAASSTS